VSFQHVKDIDPTGRVDAGELDAQLAAAINRIWLGLEVFQVTKGLLRFFIGIQLRLFLTTHKAFDSL
jgi:hypothetical protein